MVLTRSMTSQQASISSTAINNKYAFQDVPSDNTFKMQINSKYATVTYEKRGQVYTLKETNVPKEYQGKGIGAILAKKTFDYIVNKDGRMKLSCDYLVAYYNQNKDKYKKFVD